MTLDTRYDIKAIRRRFRRDIEVELTMLPTAAGGRRTPLLPGFRGAHIILDNCRWIAMFDPKDRDALYPGETGYVYVDFFIESTLPLLRDKLWVGREFTLDEYRLVGTGVITAMLDFNRHLEQVLSEQADEDRAP